MFSQWKTRPWRGTTHLEKVQSTANEISHLTHSRSIQVSKMGLKSGTVTPSSNVSRPSNSPSRRWWEISSSNSTEFVDQFFGDYRRLPGSRRLRPAPSYASGGERLALAVRIPSGWMAGGWRPALAMKRPWTIE